MARRRRRKAASHSSPNIWFIAFQIASLIMALMAVLAFRDGISSNAGILVDSLTSEDIAVESQSRNDASPSEEQSGEQDQEKDE